MIRIVQRQRLVAGKRKATLLRLLKLVLNTSPLMLVISAIGVIVSAATGVVGSLFIERLINDYITPLLKAKQPNFQPLFQAIILMLIVYLVGAGANYLFNVLMSILAQKVQLQVRHEMFVHMGRLPIAYFDQNEYGDIMSRYTNDIDTLMQMISQSIPQFCFSTLSLAFVISAMFSVSWELTLFSFLIFGLSYWVVRFLTKKSSHFFTIQQRQVGEINGYNEEMLNGLKVVKVFSYEAAAKAAFDDYNEKLRLASGNANTFATILFPIMGNMGNLLYVMIAILGGALAIHAWAPLTLGAIAAFLQLSKQFSMPIAQISQQMNSIVMALAGANRIFEVMDTPAEVDEGQVTIESNANVKSAWHWNVPQTDGSTKKVSVHGHIIFNHVDFSYVPNQPILHQINIDAKPGMKVALVGETGAGKTTISNLLNRFYEINAGQITYDGIPIKRIKKSSLRQSLTIVLQETHLFTGTVMENIRFGRQGASDDEVYQAAKLSRADEFIHDLPKGYETIIDGDGGDLSQGQMQLLSLARAMIADEPVMILDEATSSIDTRTERLIQQGMDNLLSGRTSFVIAHRLSTIVNADLILVLDHGRIIESGNHAQLLAKHGYYYELYTGKRELQ